MRRNWLATSAMILAAGLAFAGPVADFETAYRQVYGTYRTALFQTNAGNRDAAAASVAALQSGLAGLIDTYREMPPPHYADDPSWGRTLTQVQALILTASGEVAAGDLAEAHETLEGVRDLFGALHERNGVETFSDRMNAYHAEMEHVLALDTGTLDAEQIGLIREHAAVLAYLAADVLAAPPPEAAGSQDYAKLARGFSTSVETLLTAARGGDPDSLRAALGGLKLPYAKLFLKFG